MESSQRPLSPFHFAFKVKDIESTKWFYGEVLGCQLGRETERWVDFNFFDHQLSAHVSTNIHDLDYCGLVDGVNVPIPHAGCLLSKAEFDRISKSLTDHGVEFVIPPTLRYAGKVGEQWTLFVLDPSSNPIEFKSFTRSDEIFS
jgi:extradiol dioxygenase family protein